MKIAFLLGEFPALSETFILNQIVALIERGHDVSIFAERRSVNAADHPDVARLGLLGRTRYELLPESRWSRVVQLPLVWRNRRAYWRSLNVVRFGGYAASLRFAWSVALFERNRDFDIVHCHFGALGLKAVLLRDIGALRGRIVTAFHGDDIVNYPRRFRGNHYAPLFARGDCFLPISGRWNDALIGMGCAPERIRVHRMGVELARFPLPDARDEHEMRDATGTDTAPLRILTVGRLVAKKGVADALHALARLSTDFRYTIVGDGPLRGALESLVRQLNLVDRVTFTGAATQQQVDHHLRAADLFLAPSVTAGDGDIEGIPVTIMEAMAAALPVVSTRHSAIPELVTDGVTGFLVAEHDVDAMAHCVSRLAANPTLRREMGAAGRIVIARDFDIAALTTELESLYEELLR